MPNNPNPKKIYDQDTELIEKINSGRQDLFERLVLRYEQKLFNFGYRMCGDASDSEDLVQETFLRVYRNRKAYQKVAKFSTWIYTIAGNLAKTELRKRKRRKFLSISELGFNEKDYDISDEAFNPEKDVDGRMKESIIHEQIMELSPKFREVILLRDVQQLSYEEISEIVNIPLGTVKSRVNRGRLKLQEKLRHLLER